MDYPDKFETTGEAESSGETVGEGWAAAPNESGEGGDDWEDDKENGEEETDTPEEDDDEAGLI